MFDIKPKHEEKMSMKMREPKSVTVIPLRDFHIVHNQHDIKLVEGESIEVPSIFLQNLKTG